MNMITKKLSKYSEFHVTLQISEYQYGDDPSLQLIFYSYFTSMQGQQSSNFDNLFKSGSIYKRHRKP